ncbi:MAG TPA: hypothetical protein VMC43_00070 [Candidatus Paceibacterota bacterium]|nr:hypothetical protein [Candidatus Paceibacterota bacterium]
MMKLFITGAIVLVAPLIALAAPSSVTVGLAQVAADPGTIITQIFNFALALAGLLAFLMIVWGGVKYAANPGNSGAQSDAKDRILQAILGLLLLFGSVLVLNTVNPQIMKTPVPPLSAVPVPPSQPITPSSTCSDLSALAATNHVPYPAQADPEITHLLNCVTARAGVGLGSVFTFDQTHDSCNYTRGNPMCDPKGICSHGVGSCHYGGTCGTNGAIAADVGLGSNKLDLASINKVGDAVKVCDPGSFVQLETFGNYSCPSGLSGSFDYCTHAKSPNPNDPNDPSNTHVHMSPSSRCGCN